MERTSKGWKITQVFGIATVCSGLGMLGVAIGDQSERLFPPAVAALAGGIALWIIGRVGAWYNHG